MPALQLVVAMRPGGRVLTLAVRMVAVC